MYETPTPNNVCICSQCSFEITAHYEVGAVQYISRASTMFFILHSTQINECDYIGWQYRIRHHNHRAPRDIHQNDATYVALGVFADTFVLPMLL